MANKETIRQAAVDAAAYRACQILQAVAVAIEHKKMELGYPGALAFDQECEQNAAGLLDTALASLADDPPICVRQFVAGVECDLLPIELEELVDTVTSDCYKMFAGGDDAES